MRYAVFFLSTLSNLAGYIGLAYQHRNDQCAVAAYGLILVGVALHSFRRAYNRAPVAFPNRIVRAPLLTLTSAGRQRIMA